mgnify:CR=1 FL=1
MIISGSAQAVLSKFPIEPIHLVVSRSEFDDADLAAYRVTLQALYLLCRYIERARYAYGVRFLKAHYVGAGVEHVL